MTHNDTLVCDIMLTGKGVEKPTSFSISFFKVVIPWKLDHAEIIWRYMQMQKLTARHALSMIKR